MWTLLSFTGRFDVAFLEDAIARGAKGPPTMPCERTEQEKQQIRDAQMSRARLRRGAMLERLQRRLSQGNEAKGKGKGPPNVSMAAGAHMLAPVVVLFHNAVVDMYPCVDATEIRRITTTTSPILAYG